MSINIGVIGAGRIGKIHAENLVTRISGANVPAIASLNIEETRVVAENLNIPFVTDDYREIIHHPEIDAVAICSSTDTHTEMMIEAAEAGKHIFCEKPIDFSLERIDAALKAVEEAGVRLQIGFNRRFDANFRRLRRAILKNEIGEPHLLHIISRDPAPPPIDYIKVSGGLFFDMTIHDFDMSRFLIGSEISEIYARADVKVDPAIGEAGDIDTAVIMLRYENGVIGTIDNSRRAVYGYDQRAEVFGSGGAARIENNYDNQVIISNKVYIQRDLPMYFFLERYAQSYVDELQAFINALEKDMEPPVKGIDGRVPVVMAMAAYKSLKENRPVKLSEVDR